MKHGVALLTGALLLGAVLSPAGLTAQTSTETGPDTVVFAARRGAVTFTHGKHAALTECVTCHHASRPEKPLESEYQTCRSCHTDPPTEPVKTPTRDAMHNTVAKQGICYDCHATEAAAGKAVPTKCAECHIKD